MRKGTYGPLRLRLCRNNEEKEAVMGELLSNQGKFIRCLPMKLECWLVLKQKYRVPAPAVCPDRCWRLERRPGQQPPGSGLGFRGL